MNTALQAMKSRIKEKKERNLYLKKKETDSTSELRSGIESILGKIDEESRSL